MDKLNILIVIDNEDARASARALQREAYLFWKPVVVLREVTEWVELVESGLALLVDVEGKLEPERILDWRPSGYVEGLLGDEHSPMKIAEILREYLESGNI